jgi:hypothetical protein
MEPHRDGDATGRDPLPNLRWASVFVINSQRVLPPGAALGNQWPLSLCTDVEMLAFPHIDISIFKSQFSISQIYDGGNGNVCIRSLASSGIWMTLLLIPTRARPFPSAPFSHFAYIVQWDRTLRVPVLSDAIMASDACGTMRFRGNSTVSPMEPDAWRSN